MEKKRALLFPGIARCRLGFVFFYLVALLATSGEAFSTNNSHGSIRHSKRTLCRRLLCLSSTRRDLIWKVPVGAVAAYAYGRLAFNALSVQGIQYPPGHEKRAQAVLSQSLAVAAAASDQSCFRILEIGIGNCRVIRRGLYDDGLKQLTLANQKGIYKVEITGVDLQLPKEDAVREARRRLVSSSTGTTNIDLSIATGDITSQLPYPDGYFDAVVSFLTLCSVSDPTLALTEIKRLIRPNGGTFCYLEHVAVNPDEASSSRAFLELQQRVLDPLQQALADNCHLHRYTQDTVFSKFDITAVADEQVAASPSSAKLLHSERFFVDSMWPVSCQCCGVIQRTLV